MLFSSSGYEYDRQVPLVAVDRPGVVVRRAGDRRRQIRRQAPRCSGSSRAPRAADTKSRCRSTQLVPSELASGAPSVLNSMPAEAVVEFDTIVLLMMLTFSASSSEMPAPSQPATLLAMMLLVTFGDHHWDGVVGNATTSEPLMFWKRKPPPLPASARVAHDQVGVDHQARPDAVARRAQDRRIDAVGVGRRAAGRVDVRGAHDQQAAAVGRDGRVQALVEQDRVVLDVAVVAEAHVTEAAAVAAAQVAAHPVVVELVVVGAGADADAARAGRRGREQFVAGRGVQRDVVVVDVDVQVLAVRLHVHRSLCRWLTQEPGAAFVAPAPAMYAGGNSPWPRLMPPDSVPALL